MTTVNNRSVTRWHIYRMWPGRWVVEPPFSGCVCYGFTTGAEAIAAFGAGLPVLAA